MHKISIFRSNNYENVVWFFVAILILLLTSPFEIPIWGDRAYFVYMSQVVFRGGELYNQTTFGYTPLSQLIAGYVMQIVNFLFGDVSTIVIMKSLGVLLYGVSAMLFFNLVRRFFQNLLVVRMITLFFIGISFLQYLCSTNLEPKILAMTLEVAGIICITRNKYLYGGMFFALAAMCWQPMVVNCFAVTLFIFVSEDSFTDKITNFSKLSFGVIIGILPIIIYLTSTDQWQSFWDQAVIRKVNQEGAELMTDPLQWLKIVVSDKLTNESLMFILGFLGFVLIAFFTISAKLKRDVPAYFVNRKEELRLLLIITLFWAMFNTLEFQGVPDLVPLMPVILIWAGFMLVFLLEKFPYLNSNVLLIATAVYAIFNTFSYPVIGTFSEQKEWINTISQEKKATLPMVFIEYAAINEIPSLTKYVSFSDYEDPIINRQFPDYCSDIIRDFKKSKNIKGIVVRIIENEPFCGECAARILDEFADKQDYQYFSVQIGRDHFLRKRKRNKFSFIYYNRIDR